MITLKKVELADKDKFWNIFQKYCYEMSAFYDRFRFKWYYEYEYFDAILRKIVELLILFLMIKP